MTPPADFPSALRKALGDFQSAIAGEPVLFRASAPLAKSTASLTEAVSPIPFRTMQEVLRPLFDKGLPRPPAIGDHPDYVHLRGTSTKEKGAITTLFMDIEGSTRLGLLYSPEVVFAIKNLLICSAIEIVLAFDGHVHRIMGDAVMAFFGGKSRTSEDGAIDAINCAAMLRYFVETTAMKALKGDGFEDSIGIRIGLDYGHSQSVLWSTYGYPGIEEVTATSFFVDAAAKLQQGAPRNQVMLGQSICELLDFPADLLDDKVVQKDGRNEPEPYLRPNHTDRSGKPANYRQRLLRWSDYLRLTPVAPFDPERFMDGDDNARAFSVSVTQDVSRGGASERTYAPCSRALPKEKGLTFVVTQHNPLLGACKVRFAVENHGSEASTAPNGNFGNHESSSDLKSYVAENEESTAFRGLHFMTVELSNSHGLAHRRCLGVFVM